MTVENERKDAAEQKSARWSGVTAEALAAMRGLADKGTLSPEAVVKAAKAKGSPLHDYFDWDDTEAARCWRLAQAGHLIRRVRVRLVESKQEPIRAFVSLTSDRTAGRPGEVSGSGVYRPIERVLGDVELRAQLLDDALHEMRAFKSKYSRLSELREVFSAMDAAIQKQLAVKAAREPALAGKKG